MPPRAVPSSFVMTSPVTPAARWNNLDLAERVLADGGVEDEEGRVRRRVVAFLHDADDFFELRHEPGLVLEPPGGVDEEDVDALLPGLREGVEGEARGVRPLRAGDDRGAGALAPDLELLDRRGAEGVARGEHHASGPGV